MITWGVVWSHLVIACFHSTHWADSGHPLSVYPPMPVWFRHFYNGCDVSQELWMHEWYLLEPKWRESIPNLSLTFWETDFWHNCCTRAIVTFLWRGWGQISDTIPTTRIYGICLKTVHSSIKQKLPKKGTFSPKPIPRKHCCAAQKLENCW